MICWADVGKSPSMEHVGREMVPMKAICLSLPWSSMTAEFYVLMVENERKKGRTMDSSKGLSD